MATYVFSGQGVQTLTARTTHLFIDVLVLGTGYSTGLAIPVNYFPIGLFRLGINGYFFPVIPLDAFRQVILVPDRCDQIGYYLSTTTSVQVVEDNL